MEILYTMNEPLDSFALALAILLGMVGLGLFIGAIVMIAGGDKDTLNWGFLATGLIMVAACIVIIGAETNRQKKLVIARISPETAYSEIAPEWKYVQNHDDIYTLKPRNP